MDVISAVNRPAFGPRFETGDRVRVIGLGKSGHVRTPDYIIGCAGTIIQMCGLFLNPEDLSRGITSGGVVALYRVRFEMTQVWPAHPGPAMDSLCIEIYDHWLERVVEET
jgi:hypothetical protein